MLETIIQFIVDSVAHLGYPGIVILMFLESSFFPFPSEVVMVPAGYLASQGQMDFTTVILMGIIGSILGALFNYWLAVTLGRKLLHKYEKWFFLNEEKLQKVEKYFESHGEISTFIGRLIPLIRQYISFPAGIARMNIPKFCFYTGLGAGLWVLILTIIGYMVGENEALVAAYTKEGLIGVLILSTVIVGVYILRHRRKKYATVTTTIPNDMP